MELRASFQETAVIVEALYKVIPLYRAEGRTETAEEVSKLVASIMAPKIRIY